MIHELEQRNGRILAIDCRFPEAQAVMDANNPGWVFVDGLNVPRAALVWAQGIEGFYLVGDASSAVFRDELDSHIEQVLKPRLRNLGVAWFEISGDENWDPVIRNASGKRGLKSNQQWVYILRLAEQEILTRSEVRDDCRRLRIDPHLLGDPSVSNKLFLFSKLTHFWGSVDAFLKTGLGFVLVGVSLRK